LVRLALSSHFLEIQKLSNLRMGEDMMAAAYPDEVKSQRFGKGHQLPEGDILQMSL